MSDSYFDHPVAIFWDYENCHALANTTSGQEQAMSIRRAAANCGSVKLFKTYLEVKGQESFLKSLKLRAELGQLAVTIVDCITEPERESVAEKMILADVFAFAMDNPAPSTIFLITGDRDFAYPLAVLTQRLYRVVFVCPFSAQTNLPSDVECLDWNQDVMNQAFSGASLKAGRDTAQWRRSQSLVSASSSNGSNSKGFSHQQKNPGGSSSKSRLQFGTNSAFSDRAESVSSYSRADRKGKGVQDVESDVWDAQETDVAASWSNRSSDESEEDGQSTPSSERPVGGLGKSAQTTTHIQTKSIESNNGNSNHKNGHNGASISGRVMLGGASPPMQEATAITKNAPSTENKSPWAKGPPPPPTNGTEGGFHKPTIAAVLAGRINNGTKLTGTSAVTPSPSTTTTTTTTTTIAAATKTVDGAASSSLPSAKVSAQATGGRTSSGWDDPEIDWFAAPGASADWSTPAAALAPSGSGSGGWGATSSHTTNNAKSIVPPPPPLPAKQTEVGRSSLGGDEYKNTWTWDDPAVRGVGNGRHLSGGGQSPKGPPQSSTVKTSIPENSSAINKGQPTTGGENSGWGTVRVQSLPPQTQAFASAAPPGIATTNITPTNTTTTTTTTTAAANMATVTNTTIPTPAIQPTRQLDEKFRAFYELLMSYRKQGVNHPARSDFAIQLLERRPKLYAQIGVDKYKTYTDMAIEVGLVEIGGPTSTSWVKLAPSWVGVRVEFVKGMMAKTTTTPGGGGGGGMASAAVAGPSMNTSAASGGGGGTGKPPSTNAATATIKPTTTTAAAATSGGGPSSTSHEAFPPVYKPLVYLLRRMIGTGTPQPLLTEVSQELVKKKQLAKMLSGLGVQNFAQLVVKARDDQIIHTQGTGDATWVRLRKEWAYKRPAA